MDDPEPEEKIMDSLRICGHRPCVQGGHGVLLRCNDAALPQTGARAPSRLHAAPALGYKPPYSAHFSPIGLHGDPVPVGTKVLP
jgi:hypothetical protein